MFEIDFSTTRLNLIYAKFRLCEATTNLFVRLTFFKSERFFLGGERKLLELISNMSEFNNSALILFVQSFT